MHDAVSVVNKEGLQIWGVAVNMLNKQLKTADRGWPSSLRIECEASNLSPHLSVLALDKIYKIRLLWDDLNS
jgi:hypothetical protein